MRGALLGFAMSTASLLGCGSSNQRADASVPPIDAAPEVDAAIDAPAVDAMIDAPPPCPKTLLVGGRELAAQGWLTASQAPSTLSDGPDYTQLQTTTTASAQTGGQLLIYHPAAVELDQPFKLQVVMLVEQVSPHNPLDSAAAILGSFMPTVGNNTDRAQMIYLDAARLGWADDSQSFAAPVVNGAYHTYELSVDASRVARVTVDGTPALMRNNFSTNGTIALGDQTNEPNLDGTVRIRSVTLLCP